MSVAISIKIDADEVSASLAAKQAALEDGAGMHGAIAEGTKKTVQDHLTSDYLPRDGPRGDFWAYVIRSTQSTADESSATVALTELGISLRYEGGDVTPGKSISSYTGEITRALSIPSAAVPVASGRQIRPGRAGLLAFIKARYHGETVGFLVEGEQRVAKTGKNKGRPYIVPKQGGKMLYTLRTITRHKPDKNILPSEAEITASAVAAITDFIGSFE